MTDLRTNPKFHRSKVTEVLPQFFQTEYPKLVTFLEVYYDFVREDTATAVIQDLFDIRNISSTELQHLDLLLGEISDGIDTSSFQANGTADTRLMARLLSRFYKAKGTQLSAEQFFKAFYGVDAEVSYPKRNIFILNDKPGGSLIGPESLKYIQDDRRYQIFSVLLKTPLSFSDYEALYKKMVHPAGFYLAAETETQGLVDLNLMAGITTDPLEPPNYPVVLESQAHLSYEPSYVLLVMEENDPVDARSADEKVLARQVIRGDGSTRSFPLDVSTNGLFSSVKFMGNAPNIPHVIEMLNDKQNVTFQTPLAAGDEVIIEAGEGIVISSLETLDKYENVTLQQLYDDFGTVAEWVSVKPPTLDDNTLDLSQTYENIDADEHNG